MANWSNLPPDILLLILESSIFLEDFIVFRVVCKSWHSATSVLERIPSLPTRYPLLMLGKTMHTEGYNDHQDVPVRLFRNLLTSKSDELNLPEICGRKCFGTQYGWLMTVGYDYQISLFHPFSRQLISLPSFLTFPNQSQQYRLTYPPLREDVFGSHLQKMAMSANPGKQNDFCDYNRECIAVAINSDCDILSFARLGDAAWANISIPSKSYDDIVFYNDRFYAVDCHGVVVVCDLDNENGPRATRVSPPPLDTRDWYKKYLVESAGDLLLVSRMTEVDYGEEKKGVEEEVNEDKNEEAAEKEVEEEVNDDDEVIDDDNGSITVVSYHTVGFSVHKLEECGKVDEDKYAYKLTEVTSLGDRALFLGNNVSLSLPLSKYIKANCIYFTDDNCAEIADIFKFPPGSDTGIFNMEDRSIELYSLGKFCSPFSPPLWYI